MLQALILYEEALDADTTQNETAYSSYFSDSKDSAELEADIADFQSAKEAALWTMRVYSEPGNKASQAEKNATKAAYNDAAAGLRDAQEELRQLHEFNERSAQHFTETASLQGTVMSALSQISTQFSSFSAGSGFTTFVNKTPDWAKTVNSEWEKRTKVNDRFKAVNQKLKNGEPLTDKDIKAIRAYQDRYPSKELPSELKEALLQYDHHEQEVSNNFDIVVDKAANGKALTDQDVAVLAEYSEMYPNRELDIQTREALNKYFGIKDSEKAVEAMSQSGSIYDYFNIYKAVVVEAIAGSEKAVEFSKAFKAKDFSKFMDISEDVMQNSEWLKSFSKVNDVIGGKGVTIDDVKSGWSALKLGKKPGGLTVSNTAKSVGILGGTTALLDGIGTYMDRKDKYGVTSAAIDGVAHTGTAVGSMYVGSIIGSAIPIPVVGTVAGAVGGYLAGGIVNTLYDGFAHDDWDLDNFKIW